MTLLKVMSLMFGRSGFRKTNELNKIKGLTNIA